MLIEEYIGANLIRHYSNTGKYIKQNETGVIYCDAVDAFPLKFTYTETEIVIDAKQRESKIDEPISTEEEEKKWE